MINDSQRHLPDRWPWRAEAGNLDRPKPALDAGGEGLHGRGRHHRLRGRSRGASAAWMTRNGLEWVYRMVHRAAPILAALCTHLGIFLAGPVRSRWAFIGRRFASAVGLTIAASERDQGSLRGTILFGDNQFFGVNHMSEEKARAAGMRFQDTRAIIDVLDAAYDAGVSGFMCTTHDRIGEICDRVRADPTSGTDFSFYPCMPYAHKYANAVTELGMSGRSGVLARGGMIDTLCAAQGGARRKDMRRVMTLLVDAEMKMFDGLNDAGHLPAERRHRPPPRPGAVRRLRDLRRHVQRELRRRARLHHDEPADAPRRPGRGRGWKTRSSAPTSTRLASACAAASTATARRCATRQLRPIAMSVFASGAIPPPKPSNGSSASRRSSPSSSAPPRGNIQNTISLINEKLGRAA